MKILAENKIVYYIGQNSVENDLLYYDMSENSTWFHSNASSSSHVYCEHPNKLSKKDIKFGAMLVRKYSKDQGQVIYTKRNNLKRVGVGILEIIGDFKKA
jgi:predicted ribosome quality control (RQC) complex YloA/Tae2 family protein